jgi:nucleoside-diphosphate-sugar epimerase
VTRVFVAGAAGVIGRLLVPMLLDAGHDVTGTTRSRERAEWLRDAGAEPVVVEVTDAVALRAAVAAARPEVVVHQLTDLVGGFGRKQLAANARLREVGTRNLVGAAVAAGARRVVA